MKTVTYVSLSANNHFEVSSCKIWPASFGFHHSIRLNHWSTNWKVMLFSPKITWSYNTGQNMHVYAMLEK